MLCFLTFQNLKAGNLLLQLVLKHHLAKAKPVFLQFSFTLCLLCLPVFPAFSCLSVPWPSCSKHCMVGHKLRGMGEGREGGMGEGREGGMVVGRGVVGSDVVVRALSGQCGRVVSMEQGVGVVVVEVLGECGG